MKRIKLLAIMALCVILSCQKEDKSAITVNSSSKSNNVGQNFPTNQMRMVSDGPFSQFIPIDSANKMINSYLSSINASANDSDLQSIIFNADSLRVYLLNNPNIKQVKFMFAHTLNYINAGKYGMNCGYQTGELTLVVAGYDQNNNYIYYGQNMVLDHAQPCPDHCPGSGTAAFSTLR